MTILILGGSGFLSGTVARAALAAGHTVHVVTRGTRPVPDGVIPHTADRHDAAAFARAVEEALGQADGSFDLVADVICFTPEDAKQDVAAFAGRARRFVMISTDFVYDPARRRFPQTEADADYLTDGYGGQKRAAEEVLLAAGAAELPWVVLRPGHIYGPGSLLGCLPPGGRDPQLVDKLRDGATVGLVGAGTFLQQPIFALDLARVVLELAAVPDERCAGGIYNVAGPDVVESVAYYRAVADALGVELRVDEVPVLDYAREHPEKASFLCHRLYDLSRLAATGVRLPDTPLAEGLRAQVEHRLRHHRDGPH